MGLYPELWAGGMGGVVVADWVSQYEDEPEAMRGYDMALIGGTLEEKRGAYVKSSPLTYVEKLKAPLLIIQWRNDVQDPRRQVELYEATAKKLGKLCQWSGLTLVTQARDWTSRWRSHTMRSCSAGYSAFWARRMPPGLPNAH